MEEQTINNQQRDNGNRPERRNDRRGRDDQKRANRGQQSRDRVADNNQNKEQVKSDGGGQRENGNKMPNNANNQSNKGNRPTNGVNPNAGKSQGQGNGKEPAVSNKGNNANNEVANAGINTPKSKDKRRNGQATEGVNKPLQERDRGTERVVKPENQPANVSREAVNVKKDTPRNIRVGITHGDFNGVNYEILFNGLFNRTILDICKPIVYGHAKIAREFKRMVGMSEYGFSFIKGVEQATRNEVYLVNISENEYQINVGQVTKEAGELAFLALERAVADIKLNKIDVIVTAPINKNSINQAEGFDFPGHTEYFANRFNAEKTLMLMVADNLRVAVATNHVPVDKLNKVITKELIIDKVNTLNQSLKRDFAIDMPKIAVLSLNPHCGDGGVIGHEEQDVILPAVEELRNNGMIVNGPFAADGFFSSPTIYGKYDAVLAMYHDQGMIPFKMIAGDCGVNFTAGLPIVRTSPAHGTAFDIAGQNKASHLMLLEAMVMACNIYRNRKEYDELTANRLK